MKTGYLGLCPALSIGCPALSIWQGYHLAVLRVAHRFKNCPSSRGLGEGSRILELFTKDTGQTLIGVIMQLSTIL